MHRNNPLFEFGFVNSKVQIFNSNINHHLVNIVQRHEKKFKNTYLLVRHLQILRWRTE